MERRFNEAPAERGGKHGGQREHCRIHLASMRPPLNAGENASPRLRRRALGELACFNEAPAERGGKRRTDVHLLGGHGQRGASMRPPLNAGENTRCKVCKRRRAAGKPGFNEAPAERGGKLRRSATVPAAPLRAFGASMRPPLNAGENRVRSATPPSYALVMLQ